MPDPAKPPLPVPKFPPAVHVVPSYSSVFVSDPLPPKITASVCAPAAANKDLAVPTFPPAVQVLPLYSSETLVRTVGPEDNKPLAHKAAV